MTVRQLVWDMDGTLLDSSIVVPAAYVAAVRRLGGPELTPAQVVASYSLGPPEALLAHLLGRELAAADSEAYYDELSAVTALAYAGVEDVLAALRARGHRVAVFTGASTRAATMLLAAAGIEVDVLVGGDEVVRPKPAADGLLLAARRLGIAPADLAYIGDAPNDLRAATAAGGISAAAAWGHQYQSAEPADVTLAAPAEALTLLLGRLPAEQPVTGGAASRKQRAARPSGTGPGRIRSGRCSR
jgi:HAD superfamily hydrolase (TIGR01509 family)